MRATTLGQCAAAFSPSDCKRSQLRVDELEMYRNLPQTKESFTPYLDYLCYTNNLFTLHNNSKTLEPTPSSPRNQRHQLHLPTPHKRSYILIHQFRFSQATNKDDPFLLNQLEEEPNKQLSHNSHWIVFTTRLKLYGSHLLC